MGHKKKPVIVNNAERNSFESLYKRCWDLVASNVLEYMVDFDLKLMDRFHCFVITEAGKEKLQEGTYKALMDLQEAYTKCIHEGIIMSQQQEALLIKTFMDEIYKTKIFTYFFVFFKESGGNFIPNNKLEFRERLELIWFGVPARIGPLFSHVFMETVDRAGQVISGGHNYLQLWEHQENQRIRYGWAHSFPGLCPLPPPFSPRVVTAQFDLKIKPDVNLPQLLWFPKHQSTTTVGSPPEFDFLMFSYCYLERHSHPQGFVAKNGNQEFEIVVGIDPLTHAVNTIFPKAK